MCGTAGDERRGCAWGGRRGSGGSIFLVALLAAGVFVRISREL